MKEELPLRYQLGDVSAHYQCHIAKEALHVHPL